MAAIVRPVEEKDCQLLWEWRNAEHIRQCMIRDEYIEYHNHLEWFKRMLQDTQHVYLMFEDDAHRLGVTYFTDINMTDKNCMWGFYIVEKDAPK